MSQLNIPTVEKIEMEKQRKTEIESDYMDTYQKAPIKNKKN